MGGDCRWSFGEVIVLAAGINCILHLPKDKLYSPLALQEFGNLLPRVLVCELELSIIRDISDGDALCKFVTDNGSFSIFLQSLTNRTAGWGFSCPTFGASQLSLLYRLVHFGHLHGARGTISAPCRLLFEV